MTYLDGTNGQTTFTDDSPLGATLTGFGGVAVSNAVPFEDLNAAFFDGVDDYISVGVWDADIHASYLGDFMLAVRVYPTTTGTETPIFSTRPVGPGGTLYGAGFELTRNAANRVVFGYQSGNGFFNLAVGSATYPLATNAWSKIVVRRQGGYLRIFVNGQIAYSASISSNIYFVALNAPVIGHSKETNTFWSGYIGFVEYSLGTGYYNGLPPYPQVGKIQTGFDPSWPFLDSADPGNIVATEDFSSGMGSFSTNMSPSAFTIALEGSEWVLKSNSGAGTNNETIYKSYGALKPNRIEFEVRVDAWNAGVAGGGGSVLWLHANSHADILASNSDFASSFVPKDSGNGPCYFSTPNVWHSNYRPALSVWYKVVVQAKRRGSLSLVRIYNSSGVLVHHEFLALDTSGGKAILANRVESVKNYWLGFTSIAFNRTAAASYKNVKLYQEPEVARTILSLHADDLADTSCYKSKTVTLAGATVVSTSQVKFGNASFLVPNTGLSVLNSVQVAAHEDLDFGVQDFTFKLWAFRLVNTYNSRLFTFVEATGLFSFFVAATTNLITLQYRTSGGAQTIATGVPFPVGSWAWVVIQRRGANFEFYLNSAAPIVTAITGGLNSTVNFTGGLFLGSYNIALNQNWGGYLDDIQLNLGAALESGSPATPPALTFCDSTTAGFSPPSTDRADALAGMYLELTQGLFPSVSQSGNLPVYELQGRALTLSGPSTLGTAAAPVASAGLVGRSLSLSGPTSLAVIAMPTVTLLPFAINETPEAGGILSYAFLGNGEIRRLEDDSVRGYWCSVGSDDSALPWFEILVNPLIGGVTATPLPLFTFQSMASGPIVVFTSISYTVPCIFNVRPGPAHPDYDPASYGVVSNINAAFSLGGGA